MAKPGWQDLWRRPVHLFAFGFGSGLAPKAPGTFGTIAAIPLYLLLAGLPLWAYGLVVVLAFAAGVYICDKTARDLGVHDHPGIVWDEFVGLWITLLAVPLHWFWLLLGFAWFRLFDVLKPWPISWCDRNVGGGFGIMLDDVLAGIMALVAMQVCLRVLPW